MHFSFCMLVVVSVYMSMSSANEFDTFDVVESIVVPARPEEEQSTTPKSDEGKRRKRSISSTDRTNIINKINSLRRSVGSSDMNYLTYSTSLEYDVANWTSYCDYDEPFYTTATSHVLKYASKDPPDHVSVLEEVFGESQFYYLFRSIFLQTVGVSDTYCLTARVKGKYYFGVYITGYAFSHTSYFNESRRQYTPGKECTTCLSGSYWCYEGLCRDDCTSQISGCSCYTGCTKCRDWNRASCTCPSQLYTDAVTLDCNNRVSETPAQKVQSATAFKADASLAMILLSTMALFGLL